MIAIFGLFPCFIGFQADKLPSFGFPIFRKRCAFRLPISCQAPEMMSETAHHGLAKASIRKAAATLSIASLFFIRPKENH